MLRVLLACGDMAFCESLREFFEAQKDLSVCAVTTSDADAVRKAIKCSPDLIILEMEFSSKTGLDIPAALKIARPRIPVFLITSNIDVYAEKEALSQGVDAVFDKGQDFSSLLMNARSVGGLDDG
jgi:DNA-binding NarL/FixJ family response regulator